MKKYYLIVLAVLTGFLFIRASLVQSPSEINKNPQVSGFEIPQDVQIVIDNSCYGCHNSDSRNEKGKKKLEFDKLGELSKAKLAGKLTSISEVITDGDMPPKKVLVDHPEMALTEETAKTLSDWATMVSNRLME